MSTATGERAQAELLYSALLSYSNSPQAHLRLP